MNSEDKSPLNFERVNEYPMLALAFQAITESKSLAVLQPPGPLLSMEPNIQIQYVSLALGEVAKVLFSVVLLLNSDADKEPQSNIPIFESIRYNQKSWYRKLLEGLIEVANFETTNEERYYRHLIRIREYSTIFSSIGVEKTFYGCDNKNKAHLCKTLFDSIVSLDDEIDLSRCWYLKKDSRKRFNERNDGASIRQFQTFDQLLRNVLKSLSPGEKILVGFSYFGYSDASNEIHWSIGVPDSFNKSPKAEDSTAAGIHQISMIALAIILRLYKLASINSELIVKLNDALSENEVSKSFLHEGTDKGLEVGDLVQIPFGYGTVVKVYNSDYDYKSYEVVYINDPPIPEIPRDHFPAMHVKLILKKDQVVSRLMEQYRPLFENVVNTESLSDEEYLKIIAQALRSTISKFNKLSVEEMAALKHVPPEFEVVESGDNQATIRLIENRVEIAKYFATRASDGLGGYVFTMSGGKVEATLKARSFEQAAMLYRFRNLL